MAARHSATDATGAEIDERLGGAMKGLKGKRIIIGGGATGIGAALAERLVEEGAAIVVGDINEAALKNNVANLAKKGKAIAVTFDLADENSIYTLVNRGVDELGGLDGLAITGADLSNETLGHDFEVGRIDGKVWDRTLRVNLIGHALLMQAAIPHLLTAGGGSIVTTSSLAAQQPMNTMPAYSASKAGLHALMRNVATTYGKQNIRCNAVAPGLVLTEGGRVNLSQEMMDDATSKIPLTRLGEPKDLAAMIAFLLSDDGEWITGQVYGVNGGNMYRE